MFSLSMSTSFNFRRFHKEKYSITTRAVYSVNIDLLNVVVDLLSTYFFTVLGFLGNVTKLQVLSTKLFNFLSERSTGKNCP